MLFHTPNIYEVSRRCEYKYASSYLIFDGIFSDNICRETAWYLNESTCASKASMISWIFCYILYIRMTFHYCECSGAALSWPSGQRFFHKSYTRRVFSQNASDGRGLPSHEEYWKLSYSSGIQTARHRSESNRSFSSRLMKTRATKVEEGRGTLEHLR